MISSFLGLQTSLRGLLAQQQALDVAAHNVANANTVGYTRQEATLGAADPLHLTAGAHAERRRRVPRPGRRRHGLPPRPRLLPRPPGPRAEHGAGRRHDQRRGAGSRRRAPSASRRPPASTRCWASSTRPGATWPTTPSPTAPSRPSTRPPRRWPTPSARWPARSAGRRPTPPPSSPTSPAPRARSRPPPPASRSSTRRSTPRVDAGQSPNDLLDRRDQILDDLSQYGQVSVTQLGNGRIQVMLGNQSVVNDTTVDWQVPAARRLRPRRRPARRAARRSPTTTLPGLPAPSSTPSPRRIHDDVNAAYGSTFFGGDHRRHARHRHPRRARRSPPAPATRRGVQRHRHGRRRAARHERRDRPVRRARAPGRLGRRQRLARPVGGAGRRRRRRGSPPERLGRLARRGDGQHAALPARLPGLGPRDVDHRRHARHAHQPRRTGGALAMRVTTGMSQRHVLTDLRRVQERLAQRPEPGLRRQAHREALRRSARRRARHAPQRPARVDRAPTAPRSTSRAAGSTPPTRRSTRWASIVQRVRELTLQAANGSTTAGRPPVHQAARSTSSPSRPRPRSTAPTTDATSVQRHGDRHAALLRRHRRRLPGRRGARRAPDRPGRERAGQRHRRRRALRPAADAAHALRPPGRPTTSPRCGTSDLQALDAGFDNLTAKRGAGRRHHQPRRRGRRSAWTTSTT